MSLQTAEFGEHSNSGAQKASRAGYFEVIEAKVAVAGLAGIHIQGWTRWLMELMELMA